jgi:hypothetical protein
MPPRSWPAALLFGLPTATNVEVVEKILWLRQQYHFGPPATPRLNGKVERSHRIDSEEFYRLLEGQVIDDVNLFNDKLARRGCSFSQGEYPPWASVDEAARSPSASDDALELHVVNCVTHLELVR